MALLLAAGLVSGAAQATLMARDLNGDSATDAYWDSVLNITWLKNANLASSNTFGVSGAGTSMTWGTAQAWINAMNTADYLGYSNWRLPTINSTSPTGSPHNCSSGSATDCKNSGNELVYMYYFDLPGAAGSNKTGSQTFGGVTLDNIQPDYWSGTEFNPGNNAWNFNFDNGNQNNDNENNPLSAWAVRSG